MASTRPRRATATRPATARARPAAARKAPPPRDPVALATRYAEDVVSGKVIACRYVQQACARHLSDIKRSEKRAFPFRFNADAGRRVCRFIELLPHIKGKWANGEPGRARSNLLVLEPWQCFFLVSVFGWVRKSDGKRRFRIAYMEVPRKNAKSTIAAGSGLYMLAADGEAGAEVYSGATSEKQALEVFRPAKLMAQRTPEFLEAYGVEANASNLHIMANGSRFEPVIGKPGDGASPSCAIVDEYHEHETDDLFDTMLTGMGAREQPIMLVITTAGSNTAGPCYALRTDAIRMLDGTVPNEELFGLIYTLDDGDDWTTEAALRKANPNYDVSVSGEFLRARQQEAISSARRQPIFKSKHLNIWTTARAQWMNMERWNAQADRTLRVEDFAGEPCSIGLDLSSKMDITAAVKVFSRTVNGETHHYVFGRYYVPEARAEEPENRHYTQWVTEGHLHTAGEEVIDYETVEQDLRDDDERFNVRQLGYDPWGAAELAQRLGKEGLTVVEIPQKVAYLSEPMKWVEALVMSGRLHHDGNPVLAWAMSNVVARIDANENLFPRKERPEYKIDPAVALIMAMGRALEPAEESGSYYDTNPLFVL